MQYEVDLQNLVTKALKEDEIQKGVQQANVREEYLASKILEKSSEILETGASEITELHGLKNRLQSAETEVSEKEPPAPRILNFIITIRPFFIAIIVFTVIGYFVSTWRADGSIIFSWLVTYLPLIFASVVITGIILSMLHQLIKKLYLRNLDRTMTAMREKFEIDELTKRTKLAEQTVEKTIFEKGILPELRSLIGLQLTSSYDTSLKPLMAPGLSEFFDPLYEIPTESKEKLNRLLNIMPNGSIGIAGPRGAGKTTLLSSFCKHSENKIKGHRVLPVMTSAPVEYEARDFILHIFTLVCKRALELKGKRPQSHWSYIDKQGSQMNPFNSLLYFLMRPRIIWILFLVGLFLIVLSRYISELYVALISLGIQLRVFHWGIFFIVIGILLLLVVPKIMHMYYLEKRKRYGMEEEIYRMEEGAELSKWDEELVDGRLSENIVNKAQQWLKMIRFQSSYSSGWSGSLKSPIGVGWGVNAATSIAQNQLSLPEIVDAYRNFLNLVAKEYLIIIGIDELDKLPSGEKAQRFLNEVKGIFGLENCFYLISVSESAMSSFNRRGLPFRDVFDSSFDDIIYVNYLSLNAAKNLIRRRVIGMPVPFVSFCYCMSGGLARDLIRTCRNLLELVQMAPENNSLSTLCSSLIRTDITSKLRAVSASAKDINLEPELTKLFKEIQHIETSLKESPQSLLKCCSNLSYDVTNVSAQQHESEEVLAKHNKLVSLRDELRSYLYYVATMLEFFDEGIDVATFKEDKGLRALEQLARARQSLSISPVIARSIITEFRESHNMDIFETQSLHPKRNTESKHSDGNTNL